MARYKILNDNAVFDTQTGYSIPRAEGNRHWQEVLQWLDVGNTLDPADPIPPVIDENKRKRDRLDKIVGVNAALRKFIKEELIP